MTLILATRIRGRLVGAVMTSLALVIPAASCDGEPDAPPNGGDAPASTEATARVPELEVRVPGEHVLLAAAHIQASQNEADASYDLGTRDDARVAGANNTRQRFTVQVHPEHVAVVVDDSQEALVLDLARWGRSEHLQAAADTDTPELAGNRFSYAHGDGPREWYVHGPRGLEQGFDLAAPPPGRGMLTLDLEVGGDFVASTTEDGALLTAPSGAQLKYTHLVATDADGVPLPVAVAASEHRIILQIDDAGASYPIVVDPLVWTETQKTLGEAGDDQFGGAVAIDGTSAVVGAPFSNGDRGALYFYVQAGQSWVLEQKIVGAISHHLGWRVAIAGDDAISVRSNGADGNGVFIYHRNAGVWSQQFSANYNAGSTSCGFSVDIDGDTAAWGCPKVDTSAFDGGDIKVYTRTGTTWSSQATLTSGETVNVGGDRFGHTVAIQGDRLFGGATAGGPSDAGAIYEFTRTGVLWTQGDRLVPTDGLSGDAFASALSLDYPNVAVGAPKGDGAVADEGAVYVYNDDGTSTWSEQKLTVGGATLDAFGASVGLSGPTLVVGAPKANAATGAAFVFAPSGSTWVLDDTLLPTNLDTLDNFGASVATRPDVFFVGAPLDDDTAAEAGAVYIFEALLEQGDGCSDDLECQTGFCSNGVCCDQDCTCGACSVPAGALVAGTCEAFDSGTICRPSTGACDLTETCDGSGFECPSDDKQPQGVLCRVAADDCDAPESCDGVNDLCPTDDKKAAGTSCRAAAGVCDVAEVCDGSTDACPADAKQSAATECRAAAGLCDVAEMCDGSGDACPTDLVQPTTLECRAAADVCDGAEMCDGVNAACPADAKLPTSTVCRAAADVCDTDDTCDGTNDACPADEKAAQGVECRAAAGACDVSEQCDGVSDACPADAVVANGTECRPAGASCDVVERCDGMSTECPDDAKVAAGTICRAAAGDCDEAEACDGSNDACPADAKVAANTECRAAAHTCDAAETCDGLTDTCPADELAADGATCDDGDSCTAADTCSAGECVAGDAVCDAPADADTGCGCHVPGRAGDDAPNALWLLGLFLASLKRRRTEEETSP